VGLFISRIDPAGNTIDFLLAPKRDLIAAKGLLQLAFWQAGQFRPRVINVDGHPAYIETLRRTWSEVPVSTEPYLNNILEQDHRFVKKRILASQWFRSVDGALNTIAGYEAMNIIRKGQIRRVARNDVVGQIRFIERTFGIAA
jgi:transposase-like protein